MGVGVADSAGSGVGAGAVALADGGDVGADVGAGGVEDRAGGACANVDDRLPVVEHVYQASNDVAAAFSGTTLPGQNASHRGNQA